VRSFGPSSTTTSSLKLGKEQHNSVTRFPASMACYMVTGAGVAALVCDQDRRNQGPTTHGERIDPTRLDTAQEVHQLSKEEVDLMK